MAQQNPKGTSDEGSYFPQFRGPLIFGGLGLLLAATTVTLALVRHRRPPARPELPQIDRDEVWMNDVATAFELGKQASQPEPPDESAI